MTGSAKAEPSRHAFWLLLWAAVVFMVWPLCATRYLPIEDLPQHLAAIRVLHSYGDPHFGFERYFELQLLRTQYLAYYVLVDLLAYVLDLELANRAILVACVAATPLALAYLLAALDRPRTLALFALPLMYNAHLILGFVNFLMAIAAALFGLGLCAKQLREERRGRAIALGLIAALTFFCHVVPFAFLLLGAALLCVQRDLRRSLRLLSPFAPALILGLLWLVRSPAGQATLTAAATDTNAPHAQYQPAKLSLIDLPNWLIDVFQGTPGTRVVFAVHELPELWRAIVHGQLLLEGWLVLLGACALAGVAAFVWTWARSRRLQLSPAFRLLPLAPLAAIGYFVLPSGFDWIWPIAQRFALLAALFVVPVLPRPPRAVLAVIAVLILALSWRQQTLVSRAFTGFDAEEVGAFDAALASIPEGRRVVGLIYARGSRYVRFSPFIHFVAYYQARKGGAVMFTFADFPPSPFRFRESDRPPRVPPRWEWLPQRVRLNDVRWYEYVLVRAGPDPCAGQCELRFRQGVWSVWQLRSS
jgi:hypothetical protein